jgi:hypothetical protein
MSARAARQALSGETASAEISWCAKSSIDALFELTYVQPELCTIRIKDKTTERKKFFLERLSE